MAKPYGKNSAEVERVLERLRELAAEDWRTLDRAHANAPTRDAAEDALADVLTKAKLRDAWFSLRAIVHEIAKDAAATYAAQTNESVRTIEHVQAVNAWDGQRETSKLEVLGPAHERGFLDAAAGALGAVLVRPYVSDADFVRYWQPYRSVIALPDG
jgi:hypothetical protein